MGGCVGLDKRCRLSLHGWLASGGARDRGSTPRRHGRLSNSRCRPEIILSQGRKSIPRRCRDRSGTLKACRDQRYLRGVTMKSNLRISTVLVCSALVFASPALAGGLLGGGGLGGGLGGALGGGAGAIGGSGMGNLGGSI